MANEVSTAKWLIRLPDKQKPFALCVFAILAMGFVIGVQSDKLEKKDVKLEVLTKEIIQLQKNKELQAILFNQEKYSAVMKEKENCEKEKQDIYKTNTQYAKDVNNKLDSKK